jgi:hypothetical protein
MCLKDLLAYLKGNPKPGGQVVINGGGISTSTSQPEQPVTKPLPHPVEMPNYSAIACEINIQDTLTKVFKLWHIPEDKQSWWRNEVHYVAKDNLTLTYGGVTRYVPACCYYWEKPPRIEIDATYAECPGTVVHEVLHIDWFVYMTKEERTLFEVILDDLLDKDPELLNLDKQNDYMNTSIVEAYPEVGRYLGDKMPEQLKPFYKHLF